MPLIHLPVQSGSNKILETMNRKHTIEEYLSLIEKLREIKPNIKFSSDFIIGYPGETKDDFQKTINLLKKIKFINTYSFLYSARPGTPAFKLNEINENEAKSRLFNFQSIAEEIKKEYRMSLLNRISEVLFENKIKNEKKYFGRDEFFNSVIVESESDLSGKIKKVKIKKMNQGTLFGEIISDINHRNFAA